MFVCRVLLARVVGATSRDGFLHDVVSNDEYCWLRADSSGEQGGSRGTAGRRRACGGQRYSWSRPVSQHHHGAHGPPSSRTHRPRSQVRHRHCRRIAGMTRGVHGSGSSSRDHGQGSPRVGILYPRPSHVRLSQTIDDEVRRKWTPPPML